MDDDNLTSPAQSEDQADDEEDRAEDEAEERRRASHCDGSQTSAGCSESLAPLFSLRHDLTRCAARK